ncbi:hypothetical protein N0V90_001645 [Kalmusia sp. IMI 367209]|nr:hypothetical protein N0V90_001645 [Kalmusia sp. IMI 367209]
MTPKRRKATDIGDAPEPKRRSSRVASKTAAPAKAAAEPESSTTSAKPSKTRKSTKNVTSLESKKASEKVQTPESTIPVTLTIEHDSLKKPITCHQYTTQSKPDFAIPTAVFTHGAGGTLSAPAVVNFCTGYATYSDILAFQGPMNLKARVKGFHACISHLHKKGENLVLGGRSMGARAAALAATEVLASKPECRISLVLESYPLQSGDAIRDMELLSLPSGVRVLFIIGEKDSMCPLDMLEGVREKMKADSRRVVVRGADHSMHVKGVSAEEEKMLGMEAGVYAAGWANSLADGKDGHIDRAVNEMLITEFSGSRC